MSASKHPAGGHSHGHGGHGHGGHSHGHGGHGHGHALTPRAASVPRPALPPRAGCGQVLFLDAFSGIAGDMTIAALVDLGVPREVIQEAVDSLEPLGVTLEFRSVLVGALGATSFDVRVDGPQPERSYGEIRELIERSHLDAEVRRLAQSIFLRLAEAESEVHRMALEQVQFHEVGAVDAIVDIVGAAAAFTYLGAEVVSSPLPMGRGFVACRHGVLPLPAPATVLCLRGVPTEDAGIEAELVTPTGAAIVATVARRFARWPALGPRAVGWGAGTRQLPDRPNALRAVLGASHAELEASAASHALLETNLDDVTGELVGHVIAHLMEQGALDAWVVPATMKKGRPGLVLSVITEARNAGRLSEIVLQETPSLGVRQSLVSRVELPRRIVDVETAWGSVPVKVSGDPPLRAKPELDACIRIARERNIALQEVLATVQRAAEAWLRRESDRR